MVLAVLYTPFDSNFRMADKPCELWTSTEMVQRSVLNARHLVSYGILFLLGALSFRRHSLLKSASLVLVLSAGVELEQSYFVSGHCRARDLLPNLIGVAVAAFIYLGVAAIWRVWARRSHARRSTLAG
jgi:hypothetical protein